jgi:hypothetical protein
MMSAAGCPSTKSSTPSFSPALPRRLRQRTRQGGYLPAVGLIAARQEGGCPAVRVDSSVRDRCQAEGGWPALCKGNKARGGANLAYTGQLDTRDGRGGVGCVSMQPCWE